MGVGELPGTQTKWFFQILQVFLGKTVNIQPLDAPTNYKSIRGREPTVLT